MHSSDALRFKCDMLLNNTCMHKHKIYKYKLNTSTYPFGFKLQRIRKMKHRGWMKNLCLLSSLPYMSLHISKEKLISLRLSLGPDDIYFRRRNIQSWLSLEDNTYIESYQNLNTDDSISENNFSEYVYYSPSNK